jgi:hypothetical protein
VAQLRADDGMASLAQMTARDMTTRSSLPPAPARLADANAIGSGGGGNGAGGGPTVPGERHLLAALERVARAPQGWSVVALHLSRLLPPAPRPHHRRIARAVMQDAAQRGDGQVFALRNGDVLLLTRNVAQPVSVVSDRLRRLFGREANDAGGIVSEWQLPAGSPELLAYTADRLREPEAAANKEAAPPPAEVVDAVAIAIAGARAQDIIQRQVAVQLDPHGGGPGAAMHVSFRELTFSLDVLETRLPESMRPGQDPVLLMHLSRYLDQRMLQILQLERGSSAPLDIGVNTNFALHLNLSLPGVMSDAFAILAGQFRAIGRPLGIEISMLEAVADPPGFAHARARLREFGARLVLDGVSHQALLMSRPALLRTDVMKLVWSPRIADAPAEEKAALATAVLEADPARIILHRAETEAAVRWGIANRIRLFQGRYIDQMLGVQRMVSCLGAPACTLQQCAERARATGGAGRASCTNFPLLDAALPGAPAGGSGP